MSDREGPETKVKRSCLGCKYERYERYQVQGVLCTHPSLPQAKHIADTSWNTPDWCPFLTASPKSCPACSAAVRLADAFMNKGAVKLSRGVLLDRNARESYAKLKADSDVELVLAFEVYNAPSLEHADGCPNQERT